jgi:hypothetical protein
MTGKNVKVFFYTLKHNYIYGLTFSHKPNLNKPKPKM